MEYLFYLYFKHWLEKNIIDEVIWNGIIKDYGIPSPAPGGPTGEPDLIIFIDEIIVIIELTTIKSKGQQWKAEGASVPDHIRLIEEKYPNKKIFAFYLAPIIYEERVSKSMLSRLNAYNAKLYCMEIQNFISTFKNINNRNELINYFLN